MEEEIKLAVGDNLLVFSIEGQDFGLLLTSVERVIPAVGITPLPDSPPVIAGVIKLEEQVLSVFNIRKRFGFAPRNMQLNDHIIVANAGAHSVALWVDTVEDIHIMETDQTVSSHGLLGTLPYVKGVLHLDKDLLIIHNPEKFLSKEEEHILKKALDSSDSNEDE